MALQPTFLNPQSAIGYAVVAAVFVAGTDFQIGARLTATLHADFEQLAHAFLIERPERVVGEDFLLDASFDDSHRPHQSIAAIAAIASLRACCLLPFDSLFSQFTGYCHF